MHPSVRIIQGDGINLGKVEEILSESTKNGFSADNITFGCGGQLLQKLDRDTHKFAQKASSAKVNGELRNVSKSPDTDPSKASKAGRMTLVKRGGWNNGKIMTVNANNATMGDLEMLTTVYENGRITKEYSFDEIRDNLNRSF